MRTFLHGTHSRLVFAFFAASMEFLSSLACLLSIDLHAIPSGVERVIYGFSMAVERKSFLFSDATEWVICVLPNCRWYKNIIYGFIASLQVNARAEIVKKLDIQFLKRGFGVLQEEEGCLSVKFVEIWELKDFSKRQLLTHIWSLKARALRISLIDCYDRVKTT